MNDSQNDPALWRLMDANLNRAAEAIRVVEDCLRFAVQDAVLCEQAKRLRHQLGQVAERLPQSRLLAMRDSVGDVGREISLPSERTRDDLSSILAANVKRFQQALRSLEEAAKACDQNAATQFEELRYTAYALERSTVANLASRQSLADCWLCALMDGGRSVGEFSANVKRLIAAGVPLLQLRDKQLNDREILERGDVLRTLTRASATRWVMNDRVDLAIACQADGVHVGQDELPVPAARQILGPQKIIGVSTHNLAQAEQAVWDAADYIGVGPVFESSTKSFKQFTGLDLLRQIRQRMTMPAFAIGGINLENADSVFATGINRIAVHGLLADTAQATEIVARLDEIRQASVAV